MALLLHPQQLGVLLLERALRETPPSTPQREPSRRRGAYCFTDAAGGGATIACAARGYELTSVEGRRSQVGFDPHQRLVQIEDEFARCSFGYDSRGLLSEISVGERRFELHYRDDGLLKEATLPSGETLRYCYDHRGRLVQVHHGDQLTFSQRHDDRSERYSFSDASGNTTELHAGPNALLERMVLADGSVWSFRYDKGGRLSALAIDGSPLASIRETGSLRTVEYAGGDWVERHSPDPEQTEIVNALHHLRLVHDAAGTLHEEHVDGVHRVRIGRDVLGAVATLQVAGAPALRFARDGDQHVTAVWDWDGQQTRLSYDGRGVLARIDFPNGLSTALVSDELAQPLAMTTTNPAGELKVSRRYGYDASGRQIEEQSEARRLTYRYDARGRLCSHRTSTAAAGATHTSTRLRPDGMGNLARVAAGRCSYNELLQLVSCGSERFYYDARGNLSRREVPGARWDYEFDQADRLVELLRNGQRIARYEYDGLGRRLSKETREGQTRFTWAGSHLVRETSEFDDGGTRAVDYLYLPGTYTPLALRVDGETFYLHCDRRHSPIAASNAAGKVVWRAVSGPFGTMRSEGALYQPLRLAGQYYDEETGLHYNLARYYDPRSGRYLSRDPLWAAGGSHNHYLYGDGDPVNHIDPSGSFFFVAVAGGALLGSAFMGIRSYLNLGEIATAAQQLEVLKEAGIGAAAGGAGAAGAAVALGVGALAAGASALGATGAATTTVATAAAAGATGSLVESCMEKLLRGEEITLAESAMSAAFGGAFGGVGGKIANTLAKARGVAASTLGQVEAAEEMVTDAVKDISDDAPNFILKSYLDPDVQASWLREDPSLKKLLDTATNVALRRPEMRPVVERTLGAAAGDSRLTGFLKETVEHSQRLRTIGEVTGIKMDAFHDLVGPGSKFELDVARRLAQPGRSIYTARGVRAHNTQTAHHDYDSMPEVWAHDVVDALRQERVYKPSFGWEKIDNIIETFPPARQPTLSEAARTRRTLEESGVVGH